MPNHCCVPSCTSNIVRKNERVKKVSVISVLKECKGNEEKLKSWLHKIQRLDMTVTKHTYICIKHFEDKFLIRIDSAVRQDGTVLTMPRKIPKLTKDAYPSIFSTPRSSVCRQEILQLDMKVKRSNGKQVVVKIF